ncbi:hypothetical protein GA0061105_1323 [Rhizobium aethiopicum]|uniref:Metallo-beta-lactamase superfamily protein n=1 Tax=Rhizobium aethiopicum TaxID=1138170 RepID=A0A1C3YCJ5_9HYPH|nr:hypothetical protein [Rhizobium aethiopicum]SCB62095.1 hypothetical protein GA0061105_1323 [Rhizobium aethiopicum]
MARRANSRSSATAPGAERLIPPPRGAVVRMYRIGHGDCFLLGLAGETETKPAYVLIDCGYKPGSTKMIRKGPPGPGGQLNLMPEADQPTVKEIAQNIAAATGGRVDVAIITHQHQDHVNAITEANFGGKDDGLEIGETWFAWTEDPEDDVADDLRRKFKGSIMGLIGARQRLNQLAMALPEGARAEQAERLKLIDEMLAFELGGGDEDVQTDADGGGAPSAFAMAGALAAAAEGDSKNVKSMRLFKEKARQGVRYIRPHDTIIKVPGASTARAFALGPPRDPELLASLDPEGDEEFHFGIGSGASGALAMAGDGGAEERPEGAGSPFAAKYRVPLSQAGIDPRTDKFFKKTYGTSADALNVQPPAQDSTHEVLENAKFRRIDDDWLNAAEHVALDMNDQTNNSSLVLAFELTPGGKVLLFAADAQRGNWLSWDDQPFRDGTKEITTRDLLARTVLYKCGHHGSHNATLNGAADEKKANLSWMGNGEHAREFTALITAVRAWAETQKGWDHPLKAIKDALVKKAAGRVFQTDTDFSQMVKPDGVSDQEWKAFKDRNRGERLFFDICIVP